MAQKWEKGKNFANFATEKGKKLRKFARIFIP